MASTAAVSGAGGGDHRPSGGKVKTLVGPHVRSKNINYVLQGVRNLLLISRIC